MRRVCYQYMASIPMGRPYASASEDGSYSQVTYQAGGDAHCPAGTAFVKISVSAGAPEARVCKDVLGREVRSVVQGFSAGQWVYMDTYYDYASRPVEVTEPYADVVQSAAYCNNTALDADATCLTAATAYRTRTAHDEIGRPLAIRLPDGGLQTYEYDGFGHPPGQPSGPEDRDRAQYPRQHDPSVPVAGWASGDAGRHDIRVLMPWVSCGPPMARWMMMTKLIWIALSCNTTTLGRKCRSMTPTRGAGTITTMDLVI